MSSPALLPLRRRLATGALLLVVLASTELRADAPEDAPPESQAQVEGALKALSPALAKPGRRLPPGARGTIERVISAYAPGRFHPVVEGALPPPRSDAHCPPDMGLVDGRFCVDRYEASLVERGEGGALVPHPANRSPLPGHVYVLLRHPDLDAGRYAETVESMNRGIHVFALVVLAITGLQLLGGLGQMVYHAYRDRAVAG